MLYLEYFRRAILDNISILQLFISAATPIIAAILAIFVARSGILTDKRKSTNSELIKKRMEIYGKVAPALNDIYCYILFVGPWKKLTPSATIENKRLCDSQMHIYRSLFSTELFEEYQNFIKTCFREFNGFGTDARILIDLEEANRNWGPEWKLEWNKCHINSNFSKNDVRTEYLKLMKIFAAELGAAQK